MTYSYTAQHDTLLIPAREKTMKAGDLYKVISMDTHTQCQFGDYVILLAPLGQTANAKYWWVLNVNKGSEHHFRVDDLEVVCK